MYFFLIFFFEREKKQPFATNVHYCNHFRIQDRRAVAERFDEFFLALLSGNNPHPVESKLFLIKVMDGGSSAALDLIRVVLLSFSVFHHSSFLLMRMSLQPLTTTTKTSIISDCDATNKTALPLLPLRHLVIIRSTRCGLEDPCLPKNNE